MMAKLAKTRYVAWAVALLICSSGSLAQENSGYSGTCPNGAPAGDPRFCRFFVQFNTDSAKLLDVRIADALGVASANETRSIGLVISIDSYPNLPGYDVSAAGVDGTRLVSFLLNQQKFDEVILLRNGDATVENINYFLEEYLPNRADDFNKKARLLIAFSGHGRYGTSDGTTDRRPAYLLSGVTDVNGSAHIYKMDDLASNVEALAGRYFHVLTLINACYGAGFFKSGSAGNADAFSEPGSYAITAGARNDIVAAIDPSRGSLFFDLIIEGVTQGKADPLYWEAYEMVGLDGVPVLKKGLTRTQALSTFLTSSYARIRRQRTRFDANFKLGNPWIGSAQKGDAPGGFFFLSERGNTAPMAAADNYEKAMSAIRDPLASSVQLFGANNSFYRSRLIEVSVPIGPVSSIAGRPDIKIFKAPEVYPIKGYDLSSADGKTDWQALRTVRPPRFIYARAVGWAGPDWTFKEKWTAVKSLGIDHGAYAKYDFCRTPLEQLSRLTSIVPIDADALPLAIEIVHPKGEDKRQLQCLNAAGIEHAKKGILELAALVHGHYYKTPLLYGNRNNLSTFLDEGADEYMLWLGSYSATAKQMRGRNPWTLWQYSGSLDVKGIGKKTTGEVFFGTENQYVDFKKGLTNVALRAVQVSE